ncbi:kinase-like domain-containing protein [Chaetomium fimeti]|uniref:EKC/KEOPS complex subunit BUD32 n=1 Tax=Chaetomium fimeti TaxID=1854472 RepID=A0AAE0HG15_9PEZI|nr:kinase-like domain-containing protein [Chaetomium fimeti]
MVADEVKYPAGFGFKDVVSHGISGLVVLDKSSQTVIKTPLFDDCEVALSRERHIYERLTQRGGHERILRYHGTVESGIRLEYAPNGDIRRTLCAQEKEPSMKTTPKQHQQWALQIAEALAFIHSAGVVHGDLTCHNIFLDENFNAKVADFAGSSLDGTDLLVCVAASHEYPGPTLSVKGDIFAFGSVIYEITTGAAPYKELSDDEIEARYKRGEFADTASLGQMGVVIQKCWRGQYDGFEAIIQDLKAQGENPIMPAT